MIESTVEYSGDQVNVMKEEVKYNNKELELVEPKKAAYQKPELTRFGAVSNLTAGPSFGTGESGNPFAYKES